MGNDTDINENELKAKLFSIFYLIVPLSIYLFGAFILFRNSCFPFFVDCVLYIAISGGFGGTMFNIIEFNKIIEEESAEKKWWNKLLVFGPFVSAIFGVFFYFLIYGILSLLNYANEEIAKKSILFFCSLSFFIGYIVLFFSTKEGKEKFKKFLSVRVYGGLWLFFILIIYTIAGILCYIMIPKSNLLTLIMSSISGGIGGTLYCIIDYYRAIGNKPNVSEIDSWGWWYFLRPIISSVLGTFTFFFLYAGLFTINNNNTSTATLKGLLLYCSISFVLGYTFSNFFELVEKIADIVFVKSGKEKPEDNNEDNDMTKKKSRFVYVESDNEEVKNNKTK